MTIPILAIQPAAAQVKFRIALETNANHVKNQAIDKFAEAIKRRVGDRLHIEIYPSSQIYRDRDVARAVRHGAVEMGVPGTWQLDGTDANFAITTLPTFYGLDEATIVDVTDGEVGQQINRRAEENLGVKILGPWMSLGFNHFYMAGRVEKISELQGMKFRIPGGVANAQRIEVMNAIPNAIPWADTALALQTKVVDGFISTHESVTSAKMWDSGIRHAFEDRQWFSQYVPIISKRFWDSQPSDIQAAITDAWMEIIGPSRDTAREKQIEGRATNEKNGITVITASDEDLKAFRSEWLKHEQGLIENLGIDVDLVEKAREEIERHVPSN